MNMQNLMAQAQRMQREINDKKDELAKMEFTGHSEWIDITFTGDRNIKSVKILKEGNIEEDDKEILEDMIQIATKDAFIKINNAVNEKLKYAKAKVLFSYLPQNFVKNPNKNINKEVLDMTFKEVFTNNFDNIKENKTKSYLRYSQYNTSVINYLEENEVVGEKSNYNSYKNMKYKEIYDEYLNSREFEENINKIINDESEEYAKKYIELALHLNDFFIMDCKEI